MKYISQPPLLLDVHIHKPLLPARTWMDSLLAFFPGLQVIIGLNPVNHEESAGLLINSVHIVLVLGVEGRYSSGH